MRSATTQALIALGAVVGGAAVVPAMAQDLPSARIVSSARATPSKAGTVRHPRGLAIVATAELLVPPDLEAPIVTGLDVLIGPGLEWNNERFATCAKARLSRHGPKGCPATSIMGSARATGHADTVDSRLDLVFVNGGPRTVYAYATLNHPARVREVLTVTETRYGSGRWRHRETVAIPRSLQIVAGIPLNLDAIKMKVGGRSYAKSYITSTSCPRGGWQYKVTAHSLYDSLGQTADTVSTGAIPCTS